MQQGFSITYEIVTPESAEAGEAEDQGFYLENLSFGEAYSYLRNLGAIGCHCEADSYPLSGSPPRWLTFLSVEENYSTGAATSYSLHIPKNITAASRLRIARAAGCYGAEKRKPVKGERV